MKRNPSWFDEDEFEVQAERDRRTFIGTHERDTPLGRDPGIYYNALGGAADITGSRGLFCTCPKYGHPNSKGYDNGHCIQCEGDYMRRGTPPCGRCKSKYHLTRECVQNV